MNEINLVKKTYEELQDEVIKLTTDKFLLQNRIDKADDKIEDLKCRSEFDNCKANMLLSEIQDILKESGE